MRLQHLEDTGAEGFGVKLGLDVAFACLGYTRTKSGAQFFRGHCKLMKKEGGFETRVMDKEVCVACQVVDGP